MGSRNCLPKDMKSAILDSPRIRHTDLVPNRSTAASPAHPCIGLLPTFEAPLAERRDPSQQNYPRTPPSRTPAFPKSHRLAQPRSWFSVTHFHQDGHEHFKDKFPGGSQPLFLRTSTMFGVSHVQRNVSNGSIGILGEPACDEVVQMIRDGAECNRFVPRGLVSFPRV